MAAAAFLLTRPLRDVTINGYVGGVAIGISTHTPLAGRDGRPDYNQDVIVHFYSHAPCGT